MNITQIEMSFVLATSAALHAYFIKRIQEPMFFWWHMRQWIPLAMASSSLFVYSAFWALDIQHHSIYGNIGLLAFPFIVIAAGYLVGYHFIWRE